jgi:predicted small integral membrane protein
MKLFYKYASGYININDENLYLTNSGNWQEANGLEEKNPKTKRQNTLRRAGNNLFIILVLCAFTALAYFGYSKNKFLFGLPVAAYFVINYFKSEQGKRYKIPLAKIERIEKYDKGLKIIFINGNNESDFEIVDNVDPAGIEMLIGLRKIRN